MNENWEYTGHSSGPDGTTTFFKCNDCGHREEFQGRTVHDGSVMAMKTPCAGCEDKQSDDLPPEDDDDWDYQLKDRINHWQLSGSSVGLTAAATYVCRCCGHRHEIEDQRIGEVEKAFEEAHCPECFTGGSVGHKERIVALEERCEELENSLSRLRDWVAAIDRGDGALQ